MAVQNTLNITNIPWKHSGEGREIDNETIAQDAGRSTALAQFTVMAQQVADGKWVPLTDVAPALTGATLVCGAVGTNLAGFQAVADGEFSFDLDGVTIDVTGLDWSTIADLHEVIDPINAAAAGRFTAVWDDKTEVITLLSNTRGYLSTITVLGAVSGGAGTDVSGSGFLNGAAGTATQGAGGDGSDLPTAVYTGEDITAAALVAGDVTERNMLVGGNGMYARDLLVLENSLTLASIVEARSQTIESVLQDRGIFFTYTRDGSAHQA
jgi:hypothetical protein